MSRSEPVDTMAEFARDLTEARRAAGRSIRQVHRLTDIPTATLGGYFAGRHLPPANRPEVLRQVLTACDVPAGEHEAWRRRMLGLYEQRRQVEVTRTPYPGLRAFEAGEHDLFFGREHLVDRLLQMLEEAVGQPDPLVMVVGPSGSGKSSLLTAGLQAALTGVDCTVCRPVEIEDVLAGLSDTVEHGPTRIRRVLVVDQLEELWTHTALRARADELLDRLDRWAEGPGRVLVLGLRADFYGEAILRPGLAEALRHRQLLVEPLDDDAMRAAIEGPARQVGLSLEQGLVDVILADVRQDTVGSVLPHLAHVLDTMWGTSDRRSLTVADYRGAGGFAGAIRQSAEEALTSLTPDRQGVAMTLLLRMVMSAPTQGWTRRLAPLDELVEIDPLAPEVLDHLVARRLVTARIDDATLSHESLVGAWPRLRHAVESRRGDLARREALEHAAREWQSHGKGEDHLLRGSRLLAAADWSAQASEPLTPLQESYLAASHRLARQLEAERRVGRRRRRAMITALAVLLLLTTGASVVAVSSFDRALTERDQAHSRQMAIASANLRETNPALSQQLALAAHRTAGTREGRSAVLDATTSPVLTDWTREGVVPERAATMADGEHMVLSGPDGQVMVVRAGETQPWDVLGSLLLTSDDGVPAIARLAVHPTRPLVVAAGAIPVEGSDEPLPFLAEIDVSDPTAPVDQVITVPERPTAITFAADGELLVVADGDGLVHRYAVGAHGVGAAPDPRGEPVPVGELVEQLATSDDGSVLAAALSSGIVLTWQVQGDGLEPTGDHQTDRGLFDLDVSGDGSTVAAVGRSGLVHWLEIGPDGLTETRVLHASETNLFAVVIDQDSGLLVASGWEGTTMLWRIDQDGPLSETPALVLPVPRPVLDMEVLADRWVFTTLGGTVYTWDTEGSVLPRMPGNVFMVGTSHEPHRFMTSTGPPDGAVTVWDASEPHAPVALRTLRADGDDVSTGAGALSPDGGLVAMGTAEGRLLVWDLEEEAGPVVDVLVDHDGVVMVVFTPGSDGVVALGRNGLVQLIDLDGQVLGEQHLRGGVLTAAVREDGLLAMADTLDGITLVHIDDLASRIARFDPGANVYGIDFTPQGDTLALSTADHDVRFYDVSDPVAPATIGEPLTGPTSIPNSVKFSPDGQRLALPAVGGQAWIYTLQGEQWVATEVLRAGLVNLQDITWSADGSVLLGGALAGRTRLWLTDVDSAADAVCAGVGHDITKEEWAGLLPGIGYAPPCVTVP